LFENVFFPSSFTSFMFLLVISLQIH
jgi:hypothetical protein